MFLFSYVLAILPVVLLSGATGIESLFGLQEAFGLNQAQVIWLLVWGVGTLGSLYAILGGLKAVAISDTINGVGFLLGGLLIPLLALIQIGDGNPWAGAGNRVRGGASEVRHHGRRTGLVPAIRRPVHGHGHQPGLRLVHRPAVHPARPGGQESQGRAEGRS